MAHLVERIKSKVHRRSGSNSSASDWQTTSDGGLVSGAGAATGAMSEPIAAAPTGPARISLEQSAFHVSQGAVSKKSLDQRDGSNANPHSRVTGLEERQARNTDVDSAQNFHRQGEQLQVERPRGEVRKAGQTIAHDEGHTQLIGAVEGPEGTEGTYVEEMTSQRESSKNAVSAEFSPSSSMRRVPVGTRSNASSMSNRQIEAATERSTPSQGINYSHSTAGARPTGRQSILSARDEDDLTGVDASPESKNNRTPRQTTSTRSDLTGPRPMPQDNVSTSNYNRPGIPFNLRELNESLAGVDSSTRSRTAGSRGMPTPDIALSAGIANSYLEQQHRTDAKENVLKSGNLRLPNGFDLNDTVQTYVSEEQRPAVTHETIIKQRIEVVQEDITRDIHVHHYYTYVQPIRVVEVLPARHFFLDLQTGVKTEVLPPKGWTLPASMHPVSPDTSAITGWTRHYLVDEEHPTGIPEAAPAFKESPEEHLQQDSPSLKHEHGRKNLRQEARGS